MKKLLATLTLALTLSAADLPKESTPLNAEEHDQLVLSAFSYLKGRIALLEALGASKAGNDIVTAANNAERGFGEMLDNLRKKHGADACMWDFQAKTWQCPEKTEKK